MRTSRALAVLLALLLVAFGWGLVRLLDLRLAAGDVYPRYSSLRADPLGAKVLHDALERLPGVVVRRNLGSLSRIEDVHDVVLLVLGHEAYGLDFGDPELTEGLESMALHGGRVVVAFEPVAQTGWHREYEEERERLREKDENETKRKAAGEKREEPRKTPPPDEASRAQERLRRASLQARWGFRADFDDLPRDAGGAPQATIARRIAPLDLPEALSCHTAMIFRDLDPSWSVLYARGEEPVLIERSLGRGRLVLSSDSYLFSNEAMLEERRPQLLSWLLGSKRTVVFEETHLGIEERAGIMTMARRYRLHGLGGMILVLAALFLWQAMTPLVPPLEENGDGAAEEVVGKDSAAGFVSLLQRGIPPREILRVCVEEWSKSLEPGRPAPRVSPERLAAEARDPVQGYRRISRSLARALKGDHER